MASRWILVTLCVLGCEFSGGASKPEIVKQEPPAVRQPREEPAPKRAQQNPLPPNSIKFARTHAFLPLPELCENVPPITGSWREAPEVEMALVPQQEQLHFRIVGRTNMPNDMVLYVYHAGLGGSNADFVVVRDGCFVSPDYYMPPGEYVLGTTIGGLELLDPIIAEEIGEWGWKLKKHIVDNEFRDEMLVGVGQDPASKDKERRALWDEYETSVRMFARKGLEQGKLRARMRKDPNSDAWVQCSKVQKEWQKQPRQKMEEFLGHDAVVFNPGGLAIIETHLFYCLSCSPEEGDKSCRAALKELRNQDDWKLSDAVAEYRAR